MSNRVFIFKDIKNILGFEIFIYVEIIENLIGTNIVNSDTDGDGIGDGLEYSGWYYQGSTPKTIIDNTNNVKVYFTSPTKSDSNGISILNLD